MKIISFVAVVSVIGAVMLVALFGTASPCGILREAERRHDSLAAVLPDAIVDTALAAKFGSLTPVKCVGLLLSQRAAPQSNPAPVAPQQQARLPLAPSQPAPPPNSLAIANQLARAAIDECREKRLKAELRSYVESAQCSNPRMVQAFSAANYKYMDLVNFLAAKRLEIARKQDLSELTEAQAAAELQRLMAQIAETEKARDAQRN